MLLLACIYGIVAKTICDTFQTEQQQKKSGNMWKEKTKRTLKPSLKTCGKKTVIKS